MVQSFAGVLVFVVISTPVELYARVQLGRDVADVDPLHFGVQVGTSPCYPSPHTLLH
jgi:hypothetical protein